MTNRALILAALAERPDPDHRARCAPGTPRLMAGALAALGDRSPSAARAAATRDDDLAGDAGPAATGPAAVDVGNAGTVMRFVPPVAALADGGRGTSAATRGVPAAGRPAAGRACAQLGAEIADGGRAAVPFTVRGRGRCRAATVTLDASASSQLVSGLLLAAPAVRQGRGGPPRGTARPVRAAHRDDRPRCSARRRRVEPPADDGRSRATR